MKFLTLQSAIFAGGLLILNLTSGGCDLFHTREPENPSGTSTSWETPFVADQVFLNLKQALVELNQDNYLRCLIEPGDSAVTFLFVPNPNTAGWPLTIPWGYEQESQATQTWFGWLSEAGSVANLTLMQQAEVAYLDDSVRITQDYTLIAPTNNTALPDTVSGRSDFLLVKNSSGYWVIQRWEDLDGSPSWTDLRAGLY